MSLRGAIRVTAALLALTLGARSFADERPPPPSQRKLKGRDVAMLLWLPFAVFSMGDLDEKPAPKAKAKKKATSARPTEPPPEAKARP